MKKNQINKYFNLSLIHKEYINDILKILKKIILKSNFILGEELEKFENQFAKFSGTKYCIGVGNGYDALKILLLASGVKKDDEVIVSSHTFIATWHSISSIGAKPIPIDSDYDSYNINPDLIESKINNKTKAVVAVHIYGQPVVSNKIKKICKKNNILFLEDASQAHGARFGNKLVGSLGDGAAFSFYPTKNLGALGDAGAITTNNKKIYLEVKKLRNYGSNKRFHYEKVGVNSRLDEIQAAILSHKLNSYKNIINLKYKIVSLYNNELKFDNNFLKIPLVKKNCLSVWHHYVVRIKKRSQLIKFLKNNGVETSIHYPIPPHKTKAYKNLKLNKDLKITNLLSKEILSLPSYDYNLAKKTISLIKLFYEKHY